MKPMANSCMTSFQLKRELNNAHAEQTNKPIEYFQSKKVDSNAPGWMQEVHSTKHCTQSLRRPSQLHSHFRRSHTALGKGWWSPISRIMPKDCFRHERVRQVVVKFPFQVTRSRAKSPKCQTTSRLRSFHHPRSSWISPWMSPTCHNCSSTFALYRAQAWRYFV